MNISTYFKLDSQTKSSNKTNALAVLTRLLEDCPVGLSEHELIQNLRLGKTIDFIDNDFNDNLTLFQSHFLLFHYLHQLQSQLWSQQQGHLEISPLNIRLSAYRAGTSKMQKHDPLKAYYLETDNLRKTTAEDINTMLDAFWNRYLNPAERQLALGILNLKDPVSDETIKKSYRKLVMEHHPDRGGETRRLQSLNEAIRMLLG